MFCNLQSLFRTELNVVGLRPSVRPSAAAALLSGPLVAPAVKQLLQLEAPSL